MYDDKTPEQKIQALLFQTFKDVSGLFGAKLGPTDIGVRIETHPESDRVLELQGADRVTMDFGNTPLGQYPEHLGVIASAFATFGLACGVEGKKLVFEGKAEALTKSSKADLQRAIQQVEPVEPETPNPLATEFSCASMAR